MRRATAIVLLVGALSAFVAPIATGAQEPATPRLHLVEQPIVVAPDGEFGAFLSFEGAPEATSIAVDIYARADPGANLDDVPSDGAEATFGPEPVIGVDAEGAGTAAFVIDLYRDGQPNPDPTWGWQIDEPGVYPVRVRLRDGSGAELATLMLTLLRLPEPGQEVTQTQASLLVEVHQPPPDELAERSERSGVDEAYTERLDPIIAELGAWPEVPAAFAVTPDTVARLAGDPDAATTLAGLRTELEQPNRTLLDAPYVDIDAASLVAEGLGEELTSQRDLGRQTLAELLEPPLQGVWQLHDRVDPATLQELRARGIFRTVLPDDALAPGPTPSGPVDLDAVNGTVTALATSAELTVGAQAPEDAVLAAHRLLAQLSLLGTDARRSAHVVVSIDPAAAPLQTLQIIMGALGFTTPFFAPESIEDALDARSTNSATIAPDQPNLAGWPEALLQSQVDLASYESMVAGRTDLVLPFERTLAISAAADLPIDERTADAASVAIDLQQPFSSISIPSKDKVTLGAEDGTFPLVITSSLDYPVQVVVELESNDRLDFPSNRIEVTVNAPREVVNIKVRTRASGDTPVRISVRTPDDGVALAESSYTIRSTAVSGVGVVLTVGAALFLAVWWGRHWHRNRGKARHARRRRRRDSPDVDPV